MTDKIDREQWLTVASTIILEDLIAPAARTYGADPTPPVRVSVGWSRGQRGGVRILGSCHPRAHSGDGTNEVFIAPSIDNPVQALATLAHELVHAVDDCRDGHGGRFQKIARTIGLVAPWRATTPGPQLTEYLSALAPALGQYPHHALDDSKRKRQATRMLLIKCDRCGWSARTTRLHLNPSLMEGTAPCPGCGEHELRYRGE